jgi:hypothetical protein
MFWLPLLPTLRAFPEQRFQWLPCGFRPRLQMRGSDGFSPSSPRYSRIFLSKDRIVLKQEEPTKVKGLLPDRSIRSVAGDFAKQAKAIK